jgi:uncharacterized protein (DUF1810 family)
MDDPFDLKRFVTAQEGCFDGVIEELRNGYKQGHWIWFIFPQLEGLGMSWRSNHYGISSLAEATQYLQHPVLGARLIECTKLVNAVQGRSALTIFGGTDAMKFRSSMSLFSMADPHCHEFKYALEKYFDGQADPLTLKMLAKNSKAGA